MKTLLWLDDYRDPFKDDWLNFSPIGRDCKIIWVKTYDEFCNYIVLNGLPTAICFDHDLGEELTGYDCAKFLLEYCLNENLKLPLFAIQSANPVGKKNIEYLLNNYKKWQQDHIYH